MLVLGIETSCDETAISILEIKNSKLKILSNVVSSQVKLHAKYGGVFPTLAKREHQKNLPIVFKKVLKEAKKNSSEIDLIGVTVGPGLEPCLWQGINFALNLAKKIKKPVIPIDHIKAHIFANFLNSKFKILNSKIFPAISLIVSGGHTQLILMKNILQYKLIGETRDDAAGECLDKVARILGLGYPGGPIIEKLAKEKLISKIFNIKLPRPMIFHKNYDFSFSGLKTAVFYDFLKRKERERSSKEYKIEMAKEVQQAIIDVLIFKTLKALKEFKAKSLILGGGVVANLELKKQFKNSIKKELPKVKIFFPKKEFSTDNGTMVALSALIFYSFEKKLPKLKEIIANPNLKIEK